MRIIGCGVWNFCKVGRRRACFLWDILKPCPSSKKLHTSSKMVAPSFIIGLMGNAISILLFLSPAKTFWTIIKNKSTEGFSCFPYICTLLSTAQWTYYGAMKPGGLLITTVNGTGAFLQSIYVLLFIIYAPKKLKVRTVIQVVLVDIVFFAAVFLVTFLAFNVETTIKIMGVLCVCLTLCMYGAPLTVMRTVIKTKSVQYMPFLLSFFLFLNAGIWTSYAVLEKDIFVGIPNGIGVGLGAAQLILYLLYRNREEHSDGAVIGDVELGVDIHGRKFTSVDMEKKKTVRDGSNSRNNKISS